MSRKTNFIRQGTILAMASIIVRLIGIVYRVPLANIIGDEANGIYSAAFEVYSLALILSSYSLPLAVSKLLSAKLVWKEYRNAFRTFIAALLFAVVSGGIMALLIFFGADFIEKHFYANFHGIAIPLRVLAITIFVVALLGTLRGYFQARKTMIPTAVSQIIEQIVNAAASIYFAWSFIKGHSDTDVVSGWGAAGGTMGTLFGAVGGLLFLIFVFVIYHPIVKKQMARDITPDDEAYSIIFKMLIATIVPVILSQAVYQASGVIDSIMFSNIVRSDDVSALYGVYSTKYRLLVNVPIAISSAMASSMIPSIVSAYSTKHIREVRRKTATSVKVNMIIAIPCAVGLSVLGTPIVRMLFPATDYELGGKLLMAGGSAVIFYALSTVTNAALQGINLMRKPVTHSAISLAIHVVLLFVLLKFTNLGAYALVIGNVTFPIVVCILNSATLSRKLGYRQEIRETFAIPALASLVMGISAFSVYKLFYVITHSNIISLMFAIIIAVGVYFLLIFLFGGLKKKDLPDFPMGMRIGRIAAKLHIMRE